MSAAGSGAARTRRYMLGIGGGFMFFCYACYLIKLFIFPEGLLPFAVCCAVIALLGGWFLLRRKIPVNRATDLLRWVLAVGVSVYTLTFLLMVCVIARANVHCVAPQQVADDAVIWVFGAKVNGTAPGKALEYRLKKTVEIMQEHPDTVCILSGGQGPDEAVTEASVMKAYLLRCQIGEDRIITEEASTDTTENIAYCTQIYRQSEYAQRPVVCVSTDFHIPRVRSLMRRQGIDAQYCAARASNPFIWFTSLVREYMSYLKQFLGLKL